jgi:hypothetical protein
VANDLDGAPEWQHWPPAQPARKRQPGQRNVSGSCSGASASPRRDTPENLARDALFLFCAGLCDQLSTVLSPDFNFSESYANPSPLMNSSAFL